MFKRAFLVFLLVLGISFAALPLGPNVSTCGYINSPGYYIMTGDIHSPGANVCIEITVDDVIFDCNHSTINLTAGWATGVQIANPSGVYNVTVANCTIYSEGGGITAKSSIYNAWIRNIDKSCMGGGKSAFQLHGANISLYNLSTNCTSFLESKGVTNYTAENLTGRGTTSSQIYWHKVRYYHFKDLHNLWFNMYNVANGTVENLYSPKPTTGLGYVLDGDTALDSINNTLRNADISGCDDGGATECIDIKKNVVGTFLEDVVLDSPAILPIRSHSTYSNIILLNATEGIDIQGKNSTVDGMVITITGIGTDGIFFSDEVSNISVNNVSIVYSTAAPRYGIRVQNVGSAPYDIYDNVTVSDISIENAAAGVVVLDGAKGFVADGLTITNTTVGGIGIIYNGLQSVCDPSETLNDITSHHFFNDVTITESPRGILLIDDVCDIHFSNVEIEADDAGFHLQPSAGGGGGSQQISLDSFKITLSNANVSAVGMNLSKNYESNYTNGEVSEGKYCIWTYLARENNIYDALELHDCDTGFLLSNTVIIPPGVDFVNLTGVHIYDVLLDFDTSDFWYFTLFEDMFFGDNSGGLGIEFYTYGCLNFTSTTLPAPLPAGYTAFHDNYLQITEDDTTTTCSNPALYGFTNETGFMWTVAQASGYDMSTLRVLKWNGTEWIEVPGTLDLANRIFEAGYIEDFSIFTMTADAAPGGTGDGGTSDKGDIILVVPAETYVLDPVLIQTFNDDGDPLNAKVSVTLGGETVFYGFVGMDGEVEVIPLEQGAYTVVATKDNYDGPLPLQFVVSLRDLDAVVPESVGENEQFTVTVTSDGVPLEGARVDIEGLVRVTGTDGTTTFTLSEPGNYPVEVTKAGYHSWSGTINVWAEGEKPEPTEEEPGTIIVAEDEEETEEGDITPVMQGEVPTVYSPKQPVNGAAAEIQQHWLWLILLLIIVLAAVIYWLVKHREKR